MLTVPQSQESGKIAQFTAVDPDAGTRFTYRITAGNAGGAFAISPRSGIVTLTKRPEPGTHTLTVEVDDSTIPKSSKSATCVVNTQ